MTIKMWFLSQKFLSGFSYYHILPDLHVLHKQRETLMNSHAKLIGDIACRIVKDAELIRCDVKS